MHARTIRLLVLLIIGLVVIGILWKYIESQKRIQLEKRFQFSYFDLSSLSTHEQQILTDELDQLKRSVQEWYPLNQHECFKIDHGDNYFRFFQRIGKVHYGILRDTQQQQCKTNLNSPIVASGAAIFRPRDQTWYLCDLKVHSNYRRQGLTRYIFEKMHMILLQKQHIPATYADLSNNIAGYTLCMNPSGKPLNLYMFNLFKSVMMPTIIGSIQYAGNLHIYTLSFQQIQQYTSILNQHFATSLYKNNEEEDEEEDKHIYPSSNHHHHHHHRKMEFGVVSLNGVKELILKHDLKPLKVGHLVPKCFQSNDPKFQSFQKTVVNANGVNASSVNANRSQFDCFMCCGHEHSLLARTMRSEAIQPFGVMSIFHNNMQQYNWNRVYTCEI